MKVAIPKVVVQDLDYDKSPMKIKYEFFSNVARVILTSEAGNHFTAIQHPEDMGKIFLFESDAEGEPLEGDILNHLE